MTGGIHARRSSLSLPEKVTQLHWPLMVVIVLIGVVGYMLLYSAGGGSHEPWAWRHGVRR